MPTGNAVSLIQSLYFGFGSGVVAGRTGVVLQNRGAYFSLDPAHPNRLEPGKRPLHTLIASLAFKDGRLWQVVGCMGADGQPQIHLQVYTALIDFGLDIQQAVEAPRWLAGRFALGDAREVLNLEGRFAPATIAELARRGHEINRWEAWNELAGHAHGITIDPETRRAGGRGRPAERRRRDRLLTAHGRARDGRAVPRAADRAGRPRRAPTWAWPSAACRSSAWIAPASPSSAARSSW